MEDTNHDHDIEFMIQLMLETGYSITDIERVLGVQIRARLMMVEEVIQVMNSHICGELEFNCN